MAESLKIKMLTQFSLRNEAQMKQWDNFVVSHPNSTPFHTAAWLKVIYETYAYEPLLFAYLTKDMEISGILPCFLLKSVMGRVRIVSIPFSDYGGPLFNVQNDEWEIISGILDDISKRVKHIEIRSHLNVNSKFVCFNYYKRHILDLSPGMLEIKKNIDKRTIQRSIQKAEKAGVTVREENTEWGIKEFGRLNLLTRQKHGVPAQPPAFFKKIYDYLLSNGLASILLAISDSQTIAAALLLKFKNTVYYKYNASDPLYLSKKCPNHLLLWYALEQAYSQGYLSFDFGRTSPDNEGLMRNKKMWGADTLELPYYYYPCIKGVTSKEGGLAYRIFTRFWRQLPDSITEKLGSMIYKYMG